MNDSQPSSDTAISELDFSRYRTPELFATISDLLSLPGKIKLVIRWSVIGSAILVVLVALVAFRRVPLVVLAIVQSYAVPAGMVAGTFFGFAEMIRRGMNGMLLIVDLLLMTTKNIVSDLRELQSGNQKLPPPGEMVQAVYDQVIYPIIEEVISGALGFLGKPILWFYRMTLKRLVNIVIRRILPNSIDDMETAEAQNQIRDGVVVTGASVVSNEGKIISSLDWTRDKVLSIGGWLKFVVMLPCYLLFWLIFLLLILPIVIICFLFESAEVDPDAVTQILLLSNTL